MSEPVTKGQISCIHALIAKLRYQNLKGHLFYTYTSGRTESTAQLTRDEATAIIKHLKSVDPEEKAADVMRKKIISMCHEMGWHLPATGLAKPRVDMKRLDAWCKKYSAPKKSLDNHSYRELPALVTQFEQGPYRHYLQNV